MHRTLIPLVVLSSIVFWLSCAAVVWSGPAALYTVVDLGHGTVGTLDLAGDAYGATHSSTQQAARFTPGAVNLGFLPQGTFSIAKGHSAGRTVGYSGTGPYGLHTHAFVHDGVTMTNLGTLTDEPHLFSAANGVYAGGIVGTAENAVFESKPVVWDNTGTLHILPTLGGPEGGVDAVNMWGIAVGQSDTAAGCAHATLWVTIIGIAYDLDTTGGCSSYATAINSWQHVVGIATFPWGARAFLWSGGAMQDLGVLPGHTSSHANALNDLGDIVGYSTGPGPFPGVYRATMWSGGQIIDLNTRINALGWVLESATAINNTGTIAVQGRLNGQLRMALLRIYAE